MLDSASQLGFPLDGGDDVVARALESEAKNAASMAQSRAHVGIIAAA